MNSVWMSLNLEKNLRFQPVFPPDDEIAGKTTKPFFIHFFMKLRLFFLFTADCQSLAAAILRGNTRSDSEAAGKRWEWGNFLTTNVRPWAWVLQWDVRVGTGVFLIIRFTMPVFKYPGGSWNGSLLLNWDSSKTWIPWCLVKLRNLKSVSECRICRIYYDCRW